MGGNGLEPPRRTLPASAREVDPELPVDQISGICKSDKQRKNTVADFLFLL